MPGTASLSGTVTASQPFTAAQVYVRNVDRGIVHMVYTNAGRYRAVALFPGTYEVSASTKRLESDVRTVTVGAGDAAEIDLALGALSGDAPPLVIPAGRTAMERVAAGAFEYAGYDEIYPPGPGRAVAEQVCMVCHGENFFPSRPGTERQWMTWIDHMVGSTLGEQDPTRYAQGLLSFRGVDVPLRPAGPGRPAGVCRRELRARQQAPARAHRAADAGRRRGPRQGDVHRVLPRQGRTR